MSKAKRKGYRNERAVAEYWDGLRKGTLGREDIEHIIFTIETKTMLDIPKKTQKDYAQAKRNGSTAKIPLVVWHKNNTHRDEDFCILKARDLRDIANLILKAAIERSAIKSAEKKELYQPISTPLAWRHYPRTSSKTHKKRDSLVG
jgi:hypothetical protein